MSGGRASEASPATPACRAQSKFLEAALLGVAVLILLALHLPFLPPTLEDIDSMNFDLGVHHYDPIAFRPHPPGYPVFIFLARIAHSHTRSHATALAMLSGLFGAALLVPLYLLMRQLTSRLGAALASALTVFNPLVWFNSVRPMSDVTGLFGVTASQCLLIASVHEETDQTGWKARAGALLAGLALGVRLQTALLIGPLLLFVWIRRHLRRAAIFGWFLFGVLIWLVPLLIASRGPTRFLGAFKLLIDTALPTEPLVSRWTRQSLVFAARDLLVSPWQWNGLALLVLALALIGTWMLLRSSRHTLILVGLLFVPYAVYTYLLQDSATIRYAIPLVPGVALAASIPLSRWKRFLMIGPLMATAICGISATIAIPALRLYHAIPSPPFGALAEARRLAIGEPVSISGHYMFERYLRAFADQGSVQVLHPPSTDEWGMLADYWKRGEQRPILFLREPKRTTLLLMGRDTQRVLGQWRWPAAVDRLMQGERPGDVELVRLEPPRWFSDSGIATSLETTSITRIARQPHRLYMRPTSRRRAFLASGSLIDVAQADVLLKMEGEPRARWRIGTNFTLGTLLDPPTNTQVYTPALIEAPTPMLITDVWLGPADEPAIRPAQGFYLAERERDGTLFRWVGPEAHASVYLPHQRGRLTIRGRIPIRYFDGPFTLSLEWEGRPLESFSIADRHFSLQRDLVRTGSEPWQDLTIRASHAFVPRKLLGNGDARQISAQILEMTLHGIDSIDTSAPASAAPTSAEAQSSSRISRPSQVNRGRHSRPRESSGNASR